MIGGERPVMVARMRKVLFVVLALAAGCFQELPAPPGGTEGGTASTTGGTSGGTAGVSSVQTGDEDTPGAPTTGAPAPEGLFLCEQHPACAAWDCSEGCPALGGEAKCVLVALRDRAAGPLTVIRCDGECREHRVVPRGGGTDEVQIQSRTVGESPVYSEVQRCTLAPSEQFEACLDAYAESCADPAAWITECQPAEPKC